MIKIIDMNVNSNFMYIWLKNIKGIDLNCHCAKCLQGEYIKEINNKVKELKNLKLENGIYYLCGVSKPYIWKNNFHLAFEYCENSTINIERNGIKIVINNAKEIEISDKYIDYNLPNANKIEYNSCRNWQFANYLNTIL